jgi:uncharacterized protein YraI
MIASRSSHGLYRLLAVAVFASVTACNFPIRATSTEREEREPQPPTATEAPTDTRIAPPSVTLPATDTVTPTVSPTATEGRPTFTSTVNANCRIGPGTFYDVIRILPTGTTEEIVGKDASGTWWVVEDGTPCWISTTTGTVQGDTSGVTVIPAPPTPTPTRTPTPTTGIIINPRIGTIVVPRLALVSGAAVTASPTSYNGPCPYDATWHGTVTATGALTATYVWEIVYLDGTSAPAASGTLNFSGAGTLSTANYTAHATFSQLIGMRLHVTAPNSIYSGQVNVTINCSP